MEPMVPKESNMVAYEDDGFSKATQLVLGSALPMVLKCALELNLLELIKNSPSASASASQLASQLPTKNHDHATMIIDRILWFLAGNSVLMCNVKSESEDGVVTRFYSLSPMAKKYLIPDEVDGVSLAPCSLLAQHKITMDGWHHMKDAILEGGLPFNIAHDGLNLFEFKARDSPYNNLFNKAMHEFSTMLMKKIMEVYEGFEGIESLVDVGGSTGTTLKMIVSKYPSIKAINFDLPHVIQHAPTHPGVEHIGGDMFSSIPKAHAIFMKLILHDWTEAHCHNLLKNCYESLLSDKGKVIVVDYIKPVIPDDSMNSTLDMFRLALTPGGRERTEKEIEALAKEAGFRKFEKICSVNGVSIMEFHK